MRVPADLVAQLRDALARQRRAREDLAAARRDEATVLARLRTLRVTWSILAAKLGPSCERGRVTARLRRRAWRLGVSRRHGNRPDAPPRPC